MKIQATEVREMNSDFDTPNTLDEFKASLPDRDPRLSKSIGVYIHPQADWYLPEFNTMVPLGIEDWIEKHDFWEWRFVSVAARTQTAYTKRITEDGETLGNGIVSKMMRVHYINIQSTKRGNRKTAKVEVLMGNNRKAIITESSAQVFNGDEITGAWVKVIKDGVYTWFKIKTVDQPPQPIPEDVAMACLTAELRWPSIDADVLIYRGLRRHLAPRYEYNIYRDDKATVSTPAEELVLEGFTGKLNQALRKLFQVYRSEYGRTPLSFAPLYSSLREKALEADKLDELDHGARTELIKLCLESIKTVTEREGEMIANRKAHARRVATILGENEVQG